MKKTKRMKHIRRRLMAGLFCISLLLADLGTVLPAWAQEAEQIVKENITDGTEDSGEMQNPGEGSDTSGEKDSEEMGINDGTDSDGGECGSGQEQDSDAGSDVDQEQDAEELASGSQDSDEVNNAGETQEPEDRDGNSESPKEAEGDESADDAEGDTADNADTEETSDSSEEVEDPEVEDVSSVSENELEEQDGVRVLEVPADAIASGTYKDITWAIDMNGKLTVEGSGEFADLSAGGNNNTDYKRVPWRDHASEIKTAQIHVSGMTDASYMFYMCTNLTSVDLRGFETGTVTNMESMFNCCSSLESLDLSSVIPVK